MRGRPRRKGEGRRDAQTGSGKGEGGGEPREGRERERRRRECNTTVSVLMFAAISSTVRYTPGGLILTALIVAFNCILWLCTQPNPEPSHMTVLIVYCDLCT